MSSSTPNIALTLPVGSERVSRQIINDNNTKIDTFAGKVNTGLDGLRDGIAIVADGDTHAAITSGQFVYVKNHQTLSEGLYTASTNIAANAALSGSNLTADPKGGLNTLSEQIVSLRTQSGLVLLGKNNSSSITGVKLGRLCFVCFAGSYNGFITIPTAFQIEPSYTIGYFRQVLIAGQGMQRYPAHIEHGLADDHIYIHVDGAETQVPADGTYNVYGTYIYISANNDLP